MCSVNLELRPVQTNEADWPEQMRRYHWRRYFECCAAQLDTLAIYHRSQAFALDLKLKGAKHDKQ